MSILNVKKILEKNVSFFGRLSAAITDYDISMPESKHAVAWAVVLSDAKLAILEQDAGIHRFFARVRRVPSRSLEILERSQIRQPGWRPRVGARCACLQTHGLFTRAYPCQPSFWVLGVGHALNPFVETVALRRLQRAGDRYPNGTVECSRW
jgi:hypothetical protein